MSTRDEINKWIDNIDINKYNYIVLVDNSISNYKRLSNRITKQKLLMCDGFLLELSSIVKEYQETKEFPKILILDTVMIHGLKANKILSEIEKAVRRNSSLNDNLFKKFADYLSIKSFLYGEKEFLLRPEATDNFSSPNVLSPSQCRKFLYNLNIDMQKEDTAVVGDVLSVKTNEIKFYTNSNYQAEFDGKDALYNFKNQGIYSTIYSYIRGNNRYYTPFLFVNTARAYIYFDALKILFNDTSKQDMKLTNSIINLLNDINKVSKRMDVYSRFTNMLLSQVYLKRFLLDMNINHVIYNSFDVSSNYGRVEQINSLLSKYSDIIISDEAFNDINSLLNTNAAIPIKSNYPSKLDPKSIVKRNLYEKGLNQEEKIIAASNFKDFPINFFENVNHFLENDNINNKNVLKCLLNLLKYLKLGDCSITSEYSYKDEKYKFYKLISPTDFSLSIMPLELRKYYDTIFYLAQLYWRDDNFSNRVNNWAISQDIDKSYADDASYFAESITKHKTLVDSILNWKSIM